MSEDTLKLILEKLDKKVNEDTLKLILEKMDKKIDKLENTVQNLVDNFTDYRNKDTYVQERKNEAFIYDYLSRTIPTSSFLQVMNYSFLDTDGERITDFDGCVLMNPDIQSFKNKNNRLPGFLLQNNSSKISKTLRQQYTIIIESKHSLNIPKMNMKLQQMIKIENILNSLDLMNLSSVSPSFVDMLDEYDVRSYPKNVNMVFASDDIPKSLRNFILDLYNGTITEESYIKHINNCLKEDTFYKHLKNSISQKHKEELDNLLKNGDFETIAERCKQGIYGRRSAELQKYVPLFSEIYPNVYEKVKGNLGVSQYKRLIMPHIVDEMQTMQGGFHKTLRNRK